MRENSPGQPTQTLSYLVGHSIDVLVSRRRWSVAVGVHKAGPKTDPSNYRPISVLPVFSKILERAVHGMVYSYLQENKLLSSIQSGFRPLHSTSTCLTHVTNNLLENMDKGLPTGLLFLDLSKAFDTLDHNIMLDKLTVLGFNRAAVQWFRSYLTTRTQCVNVNGVLSEPQIINFGVPQGSVLGPLLFIIYINELPNVVVSCNVELYADDALIYFASKSVDDIQAHLTADLRRIINWLQANYLILNLDKTKAMLVGTHQKIASAGALEIDIMHKRLELVENFKYLRVLLDQTLSWITLITLVVRYHLG